VVGLTFTEDAVRLVAAQQLPTGDVQIEQVVSVVLPPEALAERGIADFEKATDAVRSALSEVNGPIRSVVVGLPSRATIAHGLSLPTVPIKEQRALVRSEIDLLNLLPPGQEAFDFLIFPRPDDASPPKDTAAKGDAAFFFAAEQYIVEQFRAVVTEAGGRVTGIEPSEYAATRVAQGQVMNSPLALAVSIGAHHTYLQFFHQGLPVYARRLDVGAEQILPESSMEPGQAAPQTSDPSSVATSPTASAETPPAEDALAGIGAPATPWQLVGLTLPGMQSPTASDEESADSPTGFMDVSAQVQGTTSRERLLSEIARSLDYFGREYRIDTTDIAIILLPNRASLAYLSARAASVLEQPVHGASIEDAASLAPSVQQLTASGSDYTVPLGLVLGQMGAQWAALPILDLGRDAAEAARARKVPRLLIGASAVGAVLVATGIAVAFTLEQQALPVRIELESTQHSLQGLIAEEQKARTDSMQQMDLVRQIRLQNMPWTNILRNVARAVPAGVGLTRVMVQGGTLGITGDTTDPNRVVQFWSHMNTSPFFAGATVTSIQRSEEKITFQMSVVLPTETKDASAANPAPNATPAKSG
jgi:Tfp pilus assembly PilM family ATPase/Tfp pilus assembly protein PilN